MTFKIAEQDLPGFKNWLTLLGYGRKNLPDGGCTFKGKGTDLRYVLITNEGGGNHICKLLYREYKQHINSPDEETPCLSIA